MAVEYIVTRSTSLLHRQPGAAPGREPAAQAVDVLEAGLRQRRARAAAALAARAVGHHRARGVRRDLADTPLELGERDVHRVRQVPALDLLGLPHVEHQRVAVDEL